MNYALGTDVSRYQQKVDGELGYQRGLRFAFVRATVGDYYTDATLRDSWESYKKAGCLVSAYLVTAPRESPNARRITAAAHLDRFFNATTGLIPDLPWVIDAELNRGETVANITQLHRDVIMGIYNATGKFPIIYTRQTWWDNYTYSNELFKKCDLWAARYNSSITGPWDDGHCRFRDWDDWKFWQFTSSAKSSYYGWGNHGVDCKEGDLDYFNGDLKELYEYAGIPDQAPLTLEEKVDILMREAESHGWNLTK